MSMSCTRKYIPCYRTCSLLIFEPQMDFDNRKQGTTLCISFKRTTDRTSLYSATVTYSKRDANILCWGGNFALFGGFTSDQRQQYVLQDSDFCKMRVQMDTGCLGSCVRLGFGGSRAVAGDMSGMTG